MSRRVSIWLTVIFGVGAVLAVSTSILYAIVKVRNNRGAETYLSARGLEVHRVDVLTMWAAVLLSILVMLVAIAIYAWRRKRDLALIEKMEARTNSEPTLRDK
jgi:heme/copper-type cytochrome/quinol oxidase subunit 2